MSAAGSDGNFTADIGVPTLDGLGAVGDKAHAEGEHVEVAAMPERAALVHALVGIGWMLKDVDSVGLVSHGGTTNGLHSSFVMVPEHGFGITSMTNCGPNGPELNDAVVAWSLEHYLDVKEAEPEQLELSESELAPYTGTFETIAVTCVITRHGTGLLLEVDLKPQARAAWPRPTTTALPRRSRPSPSPSSLVEVTSTSSPGARLRVCVGSSIATPPAGSQACTWAGAQLPGCEAERPCERLRIRVDDPRGAVPAGGRQEGTRGGARSGSARVLARLALALELAAK